MSVHYEKPIRFTLEMPPDMHRHLKIICAEDGVSMHSFVTEAIRQKFDDREERLDEQAYLEGMKEISAGNVDSWENVKREMGL